MADDHQYKLLYFDVPGRGEHIRYIFAYAGVDFEDYRVPKDQWPELKKNTPFGKLPVLQIDDQQVPQSNAIARYLARQFGLAGKSEWDSLQCDVLVDTLGDLQESVMKVMKEPDPIKREELRARVTKEELPFYLSKFEKLVEENGGFSVGSEVTWSDLVLAVLLDQFEGMYGKGALNGYPSLKGLKDRIHEVPNVKAYLEKRPPRSPLPRQ
ncbi:glutathione S-transferase-like [Sitophilus oryzae]|uniref:glutathione transferase n=1 Tax=Sitophilus oryzae TaxID=7048 RepID=A0A2S0C0B9_SITOR|nr:glutathione S-transferase-like [Sitophilus oryzae]ANS53395.1 glutathione-S-transferase sigma class 1 [Sitophilus oryzae]